MLPEVQAQVTIDSLSQNGRLQWSAPTNDMQSYRVEWASSLAGPWSSSWAELSNIPPTNTTTTVTVPMFYRVVAVPNPLVGDFIEDFQSQAPQAPWLHTNWGLSVYSADITNLLWLTNSGFGTELKFGGDVSNELVNFYITRTNDQPVTLAEATVRTYRRYDDGSSADYSGGAPVIIVGENYVGRNGNNSGPNLSGFNVHVIFRTYLIQMALWTNGGSLWTNTPGADTYYPFVQPWGVPMFTSGVSTCGVRRLAQDTWELYRTGGGQDFRYLWKCDGLTNLAAARCVTFQRWPDKGPSPLLPTDVTFQRLRVSAKPQSP